jgi:putative acetyltransferase
MHNFVTVELGFGALLQIVLLKVTAATYSDAMTPPLTICIDDLSGKAIRDLLAFHQADALAKSPPGTSYALDLSGLMTPDITVWTAWRGEVLAGCVALKEMSAMQGELKSMRTAPAYVRQGLATALLNHVIAVARERRYQTLCLETGTNDAYGPAVSLYEKYGFLPGPVYGDYVESPHNQYFYLDLS